VSSLVGSETGNLSGNSRAAEDRAFVS